MDERKKWSLHLDVALPPSSLPPLPSGYREAGGSWELLHFLASWVASFRSYILLYPTHSRCSVNVCQVERLTNGSPERGNGFILGNSENVKTSHLEQTIFL